MFYSLVILGVIALSGVLSDTVVEQVSCDGGNLFGIGNRCKVANASVTDAGVLTVKPKINQTSVWCTEGRYYIEVFQGSVYLIALGGCKGTFDVVKIDLKAYTGGCGVNVNSAGFKLVGGKRAPGCQYPWMVFIYSNATACAGFIVDKDHILTSAACVYSKGNLIPANKFRIRTGSIHWRTGFRRNVTSFTAHPSFNSTDFSSNIAILKLSESIAFDSCHSPVCLGSDKNFVDEETNCRVMGWGTTSDYRTNIAEWLRWSNETILSKSTCQKLLGNFNYEEDSVFCTKADHTSVCRGDGGSPLVCLDGDKWFAYGVVSALTGRRCSYRTAIMASIPYYQDWIQRTLDTD